ncbi:MAG: hypothetical protein WAT39_15225 [Planctomycetota bacterium]
MPLRLPALVALAIAALPPLARGQDDLRDRVVLTNGRELRGRVFSRRDGDEIILRQGTHKERLDRREIASMDTVRDRTRECFRLLDRLPDNARHLWFLVTWAQSHELATLARLLATDLVLRQPDHDAAHEFLGHRRRGRDWLWPDGDEWRTLADLERDHASWGDALVVDSEHFRVRTNATVRQAVDTLLDLERVYLWWHERFGESLRLYELVGEKVLFEVWRDRESFPGLNKLEHPFFQHRIEETQPPLVRTYFDGPSAGRPVRLAEVAVQALLYRTLADDPALSSRHRLCGWGEVGLARYAERCLAGPPGRLAAVPWRVPVDEAALVLADKERRLFSLTHRSTRQLHFTVTDEVATDWATVHLFVTCMLTSPPASGLAQGFLDYLRLALRSAKGDSSVELDRQLGRKVETLEAPLREWVRSEVERANSRPPGG